MSSESALINPRMLRAAGSGYRARGFSLIELLIVVAVMFIVGAITVSNIQNAVRGIRLSESGASYANLCQQARIRAVQDDKYYQVLTDTSSSSAPFAYIDIQQTGSYATGDPRFEFASGVTPQPFASGPGLTNLKSQFLPPGPLAQNSVDFTDPGPAFGPRGLPCTPTTSGGYTTCPFLTPTSYITFLQNTQSGKWGAVTVTPAGRIREWSYDGTSWSPLN